MSIDFYRNLTRVFGLLTFGILFSLIAFSAVLEIKDLDLWLHMKMGEVITSTGQVPSQDILSCTIAGKPWVNHSWLFQTVVHSVRSVFGLDGLLYMQAIVVVCTFMLLLLWTYRSDRHLVILPLLFFVLQVYQTRFTVRPDIFSLVYFILFLMVLFTSMEKRWSLAALFILEVLWTNMHGYFFWGGALVAIFWLAQALRRHAPLPAAWKEEGRLSDGGYRRLGMAFFVVLGATLINPLTFNGALYPFKMLFSLSGDNRVFFKFITELQPSVNWVNFFDLNDQTSFKALIIISAISFVLNIRRIDLGWFFVWGALLVFGAVAIRNMIYFAVVAYLAVLFNLARIDLRRCLPVRFTAEPFELLTGWFAKIAFAVFLLNYGGDIARFGYYDFDAYQRKSEFFGVSQRLFPKGAVDFLVENRITGPVFNDFNTGAYLVGRAYPGIRVFIDGRTEVYGPRFFESYRRIWDDGDEKAFDEAADRYGLKAVLIGAAFSRPPSALMKLLVRKPGWVLVYFDHDGLVFLRDLPEHGQLIARFAVDPAKWVPPASDTHRLGSVHVSPYRHTNRAVMLADMGFEDPAMAEADAALVIDPTALSAFRVRAEIHARRKDHARAFDNFRWALLQSGGDAKLRRGMALALVGLGDHDRALEQADRLDEDGAGVHGSYVRVVVSVKKKQYEKAYDILVQRLFPQDGTQADLMAAGDMLLEQKEQEWALKVYILAVRKDIKNLEAVRKLKDVQMALRKGK